MRGEDLQGLNLDDLVKLEKVLETGLNRVLESKVCAKFTCSLSFCVCVRIKLSLHGLNEHKLTWNFLYFQEEKIMNEISTLEKKVSKQFYCIHIIIFKKYITIIMTEYIFLLLSLYGMNFMVQLLLKVIYGSGSTSYKPPTYFHILKQE